MSGGRSVKARRPSISASDETGGSRALSHPPGEPQSAPPGRLDPAGTAALRELDRIDLDCLAALRHPSAGPALRQQPLVEILRRDPPLRRITVASKSALPRSWALRFLRAGLAS